MGQKIAWKRKRTQYVVFEKSQNHNILCPWRREQDLNLRRLLTSHAFQACALNRSTISPNMFAPQLFVLRRFIAAQIEYHF